MSSYMVYQRKKPYPESKIRKINEIAELLRKYRNIILVGIRDVNANQMKELRKKLWNKAVCKVVKNTLAELAIEKVAKERKEIEILRDYLDDMHALVFTNDDPFEIARIIDSVKEDRPLKPGRVSPIDVVIKKGFTGFRPGPELNEMRMAGLPVRILDGEVFIYQDHVLVRAGQVVSPYAARVMAILDIKPLKVGPKVIIGIVDGTIIKEDVLLKPFEEYIRELQLAVNETRRLAIDAQIFVPELFEEFVSIAVREAYGLATNTGLITPDTLPEVVKAALGEIVALLTSIKEELPEIPEDLRKLIPVAPSKKEEKKLEEKKEEKKEKKEEKKEEESLAGLSLLF